MYADKYNLIMALGQEFEKDKEKGFRVESSNYIDASSSLLCSIDGISVNDLTKTKTVFKSYREDLKQQALTDPNVSQQLAHIEIALKCIEAVISNKARATKIA